MFCIKCGSANVSQAKFCYKCGQEILLPENQETAKNVQGKVRDSSFINCPSCFAAIPPESTKCPNCSFSFSKRREQSFEKKKSKQSSLIYCKKCGQSNASEKKFCRKCGTQLGQRSHSSPKPDTCAKESVTPKNSSSQQLKCPKCRALNDRNKKFCISCGEALHNKRRNKYVTPIISAIVVITILVIGYFNKDLFFGKSEPSINYSLGNELNIESGNLENLKVSGREILNLEDLPQVDNSRILAATQFKPEGASFPLGLNVSWDLPQRFNPGTSFPIMRLNEEEAIWYYSGHEAIVSETGNTADGFVYGFSIVGIAEAVSGNVLTDRIYFMTDWGYILYNYPRVITDLAKAIQAKYGSSLELPDRSIDISEWLEDDLLLDYSPMSVVRFRVSQSNEACLKAARDEYRSGRDALNNALNEAMASWKKIVEQGDEEAAFALWAAGHDMLLLKEKRFTTQLEEWTYFITEKITEAFINLTMSALDRAAADLIRGRFEEISRVGDVTKACYETTTNGIRFMDNNQTAIDYYKSWVKEWAYSFLRESPRWYDETAQLFLRNADDLAFRLAFSSEYISQPEFDIFTSPPLHNNQVVVIPAVSNDYYELGGYYTSLLGYHSALIWLYELNYILSSDANPTANSEEAAEILGRAKNQIVSNTLLRGSDELNEELQNGAEKFDELRSQPKTSIKSKLQAITVQRVLLNDLKRFFKNLPSKRYLKDGLYFLISGDLPSELPLKKAPGLKVKPLETGIRNLLTNILKNTSEKAIKTIVKTWGQFIEPWKNSANELLQYGYDEYIDGNQLNDLIDEFDKATIRQAMSFYVIKRSKGLSGLMLEAMPLIKKSEHCLEAEYSGFIPGDIHYDISDLIDVVDERYYSMLLGTRSYIGGCQHISLLVDLNLNEGENQEGFNYFMETNGINLEAANEGFETSAKMACPNYQGPNEPWTLHRSFTTDQSDNNTENNGILEERIYTMSKCGIRHWIEIRSYNGHRYKLSYNSPPNSRFDNEQCMTDGYEDIDVLRGRIHALFWKIDQGRDWNKVILERFGDKGEVPDGYGGWIPIEEVLQSKVKKIE